LTSTEYRRDFYLARQKLQITFLAHPGIKNGVDDRQPDGNAVARKARLASQLIKNDATLKKI